MKRVMARAEERSLSYAPTLGEPGLRRQIAYRYLDTVGSVVDPDNICITNGGQEALMLALKAVAARGDVIAVESPTYHGQLELIDSLGLLAIEVETCPSGMSFSTDRMDLTALFVEPGRGELTRIAAQGETRVPYPARVVFGTTSNKAFS